MSTAAQSVRSTPVIDAADEIVRKNLRKDLPPFAIEYLEINSRATRVVRNFHVWLKGTYRPILGLSSKEIELFFHRLEAIAQTQSARRLFRHRALEYFDWLHEKGLLRFDPKCAWPRSNFPLPPEAKRFLETLRPTRKPSTVYGCQTNLRQFHIWLNHQRVSLAELDRRHTSTWLDWLHARGLHPATRIHAIQNVRSYLRWLEEQEALCNSADFLIRRSDLPRLPLYLPRPLPPEVDKKLQLRFRKSRCSYQLGLLLMRRTGLRIGELISLPYACVHMDPKGNPFLKVPLGKLDKERLVPLDDKTVKLVHKLQRRIRRKRALLLQTTTGRRTSYIKYAEALAKASRGLPLADQITTHRLRHTYATSLLAGGMSLVGVMRLLGHRDLRMTLRYVAITDETVLAEYTAALKRTEQRYELPLSASAALITAAPPQLLADAVRQLQKDAQDASLDQAATRNLIRRLQRLRIQIAKLLRTRKPES